MKVGLYIPCFNAEKTLQECLEAVLKQRYILNEVLVIDDGSADQTVKIASRYPVRIIRHKDNKGLAAARNTAIKNIKADFIASVDVDCIPKSDWLAELMGKFSSSKIVGAGGRLLEAHSFRVFDRWRSAHMRQDWGKKKSYPAFLFGSNSVFRKEALLKVGLYNEKFKTNYEDVDIGRRLKRKGWVLIYEPKAIVHHRKCDNIYSLLNTYWHWNLGYYQKRRFYSNLDRFIFKVKDNIGLANRYIEEDMVSKRYSLLYLDFLLALHHSLKDLEYFVSKDHKEHLNYSPLSFWVSLIDLTFGYHFKPFKKRLPTLLTKDHYLLQNFFALNLILGNLLQEKFKSKRLKKILYKHLLISVHKVEDNHLLDGLLNLVELNPDWSGLLTKQQPNLNAKFLRKSSLTFNKWVEGLIYRFSRIIRLIEISAEKTESEYSSR